MLHLVPTSKATMTLINNKILDWSKFKVFADDKINVGLKLKTIYWRIENSRAPAVHRQWRQMRRFLTNGSKIEALAKQVISINDY